MQTKIILNENEIPTHFVNINYYLKKYLGKLPDPPLRPATMKPIKPEDLAANFPIKTTRHQIPNRPKNINVRLEKLFNN